MNQFRHFATSQLPLILCLVTSNLLSQAPAPYQRDFTPNSPEASAFNKYGDIGVSQFTGSPNISFPLSLSEEVPISISYNASGNKPEEHHGWVGAGFSLNVGGMISRIKRGAIDEVKDINDPNETKNKPYIHNNWRLQKQTNATWDGNELLTSITSYSPTTPATDTVTTFALYADLQPDEFVFNFNNYSGSFLLDHNGKWVFRGNNPAEFQIINFNIQEGIIIKETDNLSVNNARTIMGFTIAASDGTEYTFGGSDLSVDFTYSLAPTSDPDNMYKSMSSMGWHLTKIKPVSGKEINFTYEKEQFSVLLNTSRNFGSIDAIHKWFGSCPVGNCDVKLQSSWGDPGKSLSLMRNAYLAQIETPYETIKFEKKALTSVDAVADYPIETTLLPQGNISEIHQTYGVDLTQRKWFKLNAIKTYNKGATPIVLRHFALEYINSASNRLQLKKIRQVNVENYNYTVTPPPALDATNSIPMVEFEYNMNALPPYGSNKIDHWGYYSNVSDALAPAGSTVEATYSATREPHPTNVQAEILTKMIYPTGGYTLLEFEPHSYSTSFLKSKTVSYVGNTALPIQTETTDKPAGGLRIKTITSSPDGGVTTIEKKYKYVKNYSNINTTEVSSGVLGTVPLYYDTYSGTIAETIINQCTFMNEQSLNPLHLTSGSPVTYSEVVEINKDNSYTIFNYSNFDNNANCNRTAVKTKTKNNTSLVSPNKDPIIDYEHLRGRLIEQKMCTNANLPVQKTINEYTTTLDDSKAIRAVKADALTIVVGGYEGATETRAVAYLIHTSPVFLTKTTTTNYFYNPTAEVATVTENFYDSRKNIIQQKVTNLNNAEIKSNFITDYNYAYDRANTTTLVPISNTTVSESVAGTKQLMLDKFMIGIPLETKNNFNNGSKVEFKSFSVPVINVVNGTSTTVATNTALLPYLFYGQNKTGGFTEQFRIISYQDYDKPTQTKAKGTTTPVVNYIWENGLLKTKTLGTTTNLLTWTYINDLTKRRLDCKIDENGLRAKFAYDGYRRLTTVVDRFDGTVASPINPQATTTYNYHYTGQPVSLANDVNDLNQNFISTNTTFINATNTTPLSTKQYLDGLGRPVEVVKEFYTPTAPTHPSNFWHQKNYVGYDILGRQNKAYLPFESGTLGLEAASTSASVHPFILTEYEASPLSRPIKQTNVDGTTVQTSYGTNTGDEVRNILNLATYNGYRYEANTLSKYTMTDENGKQTCVFKDKLGRVILTRKFLGTQAVDTYNIYDNYGQLVAVLPPGSVDASSGVVTASLIFQYTYDNLNRLIEKKVPGAELQKFFYNDKDQLVLTQDANMRTPQFTGDDGAANKYLATFYDEIGRVKKTGFAFVSPTIGQDFNLLETNISIVLTETQYYPNKSWVKNQGARVIAPMGVTTNRNFVWSYIERRDGITYTGNPVWTGKQHLLLANQPERPILDSDIYGVDWSISGYDGLQKPTASYRYLFTNTAQQGEVRTREDYTYDNGQRLTTLNHAFALNGTGVSTPTFTLSNMVYNYKDQLTRKNIANINGKFLQSTDYTYNLRGWLTSIGGGNSASPTNDYPNFKCTDYSAFSSGQYNDYVTLPYPNSAIGQGNPSLFSEKIRYEAPNAYPNNGSGVTPQYNGNISQVEWQVAGREPQAYTFKYDDLDRLTEANYTDIHNGAWSTKGWASQFESDNKFQEKVSYDVRGNIQSLERNGLLANASGARIK